MKLKDIYKILNSVLKDKVFYGTNVYDNEDNASMPYIVYQEVTKRPIGYCDNEAIAFVSDVDVTLVTKTKSLELEELLEKTLKENKLKFSLITEFMNTDKSLNRIYQIKMEEIEDGK